MPANQLGPLSAARRGLAGHVYRLDRRRWCRGRVSVRLGAVQHRLQTVSALRHHAASASLYRRIVVYSYSRWISSAAGPCGSNRSEEHTSELQSLMRISYAVFCLKKTTKLKIIIK